MLNQEIEAKKNQIQSQNNAINQLSSEIVSLQKQLDYYQNAVADELNIQSYGIYTPTYDFANSDLYKDE